MTFQVYIQAHPKRREMAEALTASLEGSEIVYDPDPLGFPSPWRTYRTALERHIARENPPDHLLILQDDVTPCRNLLPAVSRVIAARPNHIVSLFVAHQPRVSRDAIWKACDADETFTVLPRGWWVPALALIWPTPLIAPALEFVDTQRWPPAFRADDEIIGHIARKFVLDIHATVPCLIEHLDVVPSVVGMRRAAGGQNLDRVSCCFIGNDDPLGIDWR